MHASPTKHRLKTLRDELDGLSEPAILIDKEHRILGANRAYAQRYARVIEIGQDRCFAISHQYAGPCDRHGEDCPLERAVASQQRERSFHVHIGPGGPEHVAVDLVPQLNASGEADVFVEIISTIDQVSADVRGDFVGRSPAFLRLVGLLQRAAPSKVPILLLGESGTGKELCARAVHDASPRRGAPFVALECSGLGEALFESELFGHARGAFTGAHTRKEGLVEAARGGTLFLDEIGDVPLPLQVKLLRLLETGSYRPVGDAHERKADFRLVCATHRDLPAMVRAGEFRHDLYYRISAFPIELPPLRERREDIPLLCELMLRTSGKQLTAAAQARLYAYDYPGNVRELRNILDRAVLLADGESITTAHLPPQLRGPDLPSDLPPAPTDFGGTIVPLKELERRYLQWALAHSNGDRASLAKALGLSERTLYRKLQELSLHDDTNGGRPPE